MSERMSEGERLERARHRRKYVIVGGLAAIGFVAGFAAGYGDGAGLFAGEGWPPAMAAGFAIAYLAAAIGGGIALSRQTDEVERLGQYKAVAAAAASYVLAYPVWFLLWKGGFLAEPMHLALFALFAVSMIAASLFYRFR